MLNRVELLNLSLFLHFQTNSCILQIRLLIILIEKRTCCKTTSICWSTSINDVVKSSMKQSGSQHSLIRPRIDLARSDGLFHAALMGADACEALATFTQDAYIYIYIYIIYIIYIYPFARYWCARWCLSLMFAGSFGGLAKPFVRRELSMVIHRWHCDIARDRCPFRSSSEIFSKMWRKKLFRTTFCRSSTPRNVSQFRGIQKSCFFRPPLQTFSNQQKTMKFLWNYSNSMAPLRCTKLPGLVNIQKAME